MVVASRVYLSYALPFQGPRLCGWSVLYNNIAIDFQTLPSHVFATYCFTISRDR